MKKLFSKTNFPKAPGGNLYEFKESITSFEIQKDGFYVIKVVASAKNAKNNNSTDDDDLRMTIDDYAFGKYEQNKDQLSWKGFNTSAGWNGSQIKGESKTVYFYLNLDKGSHTLRFYADNTPKLISIEIFTIENNHFNLSTSQQAKHQSFIFTNTFPKDIMLVSNEEFNGKNTKIFVNGSKTKIENFALSPTIIHISNATIIGPLIFENSVEICCRVNALQNLEINFLDPTIMLDSLSDFKSIVMNYAWCAMIYFRAKKYTYSAKFLEHSLDNNPTVLAFKVNHPIVKKVKEDPAFIEIVNILRTKIKQGFFEGEIFPDDINFKTKDLSYSIHGVKKLEYKSTQTRDGNFKVKIVLYDIYDFEKTVFPSFPHVIRYFQNLIINKLDFGEELNIIKNFEVQINITIIL
jgi:hypothetical protein